MKNEKIWTIESKFIPPFMGIGFINFKFSSLDQFAKEWRPLVKMMEVGDVFIQKTGERENILKRIK